MATEVRIRRGTTAQHAAFTGAHAEITYNTETKTLHAHDGSTPGGIPMARADQMSAGIIAPAGRLTLTAGVPVPTADVASATSIFYVGSSGNYVPIYSGALITTIPIPAVLSLALDANAAHVGYHQSSKNYDIFAINDGAGNVKLGTGPAWNAGAVAGSDTARGTGVGSTELEVFQGFLVNKNDILLRTGSAAGDTQTVVARRATYLGSFAATADGVATDTAKGRLLFNAYNAILRPIAVRGPATNYAYSTAAWRAINGDATKKADILFGLAGVSVRAVAKGFAVAGAVGAAANLGIGVDSQTTPSADGLMDSAIMQTSSEGASLSAYYEGVVGLGRHYLSPIEKGNGTSVTWYPGEFTMGMIGSFLG